jgi:hypothetical protein
MPSKIIVYLKKSNRPGKKYMVFVDGKTVHFGASGMSDYTKHKDKERMKRYSARHSRGGETWSKSGLKTAGFWSKWLLWNKPTISGSKRDISSRFNVTFKSGWPKKSTPMRYSHKSKRKSKRRSRKSKRKSKRRSRKSKRKSKRRSRKSKRKSKRRSRKSKRKSKRRSHKSKRKSKRRSRKSKRRSRKGKTKVNSRFRKSNQKSKRRSRKGSRKSKRKNGKKYEDCVLKVKAKQPKHCMKRGKWVGGEGCYNPWAICTKSVGRYN